LRNGEGEKAVALLKTLQISKENYKLIKSASGDLLIINSLTGNIDILIDNLNSIFDFQNNVGNSLVIFTADVIIPGSKEEINEGEFRASRESLITYANSKSEINTHYILQVIFSGIIASLGLILDNVAVIVGAMIIAPVLGPILAITIGVVLADTELVKKGVKAEIAAVILAVVIGAFFGLFIPNTGITDSLRVRMYPTIADLIIAAAAGGAGAYSLIKGQIESGLVGVMIAASLIPVMSTIGVGVSLGNEEMIYGAGLLLLGNYLALFLSNIIVFYFKGLRPQIWYKNYAEKTIKKTLVFIIIMVILISVPLGFITIYQLYTEKPAEIVKDIIKENIMYNWNYRIEEIRVDGNLITIYLYADYDLQEEMLVSVKEQIQKKLKKEYNINYRIIPVKEIRL